MKINHIAVLLAASAMALSSCTDNFDATNTNPNRITTSSEKLDATSLFEPILYGGANVQTYYSWFWCDELIQHTAFTGGTTRQEHRYFISDNDWKNVWNTYSRYATNDMEMLKLATAQKNEAMQAVALTLKVLFMQNLTDIYGDIPYSQAFQAEDGIKQPVFDSQESVYQQMCADLEKANDIYAQHPFVDPAKTSLDGMYHFDMTKWQRFNNSLYLRLLCRISGRQATMIDDTHNVAQKMQQIVTDSADYPIIRNNDDNATVHFSGVNPYFSQFDPASYTASEFTTSSYKLTEQTIKMMDVKDPDDATKDVYQDPRLKIIGQYCNGYTYWKGTVAGCTEQDRTEADRGSSYLNYSVLARNNSDEWFMDAAEVQFILAEACMKGLISGGEEAAKQHYEQAVRLSLQKWSVFATPVSATYAISSADADTFLSSSLASWDDASDKLQLIASQKYLALFWVGLEAWHEYRRTGYPELTIGQGCVYNDMILPTRFAYPSTTVATNSYHVQEALNRMGGQNDMKTPLWWSKQAINK